MIYRRKGRRTALPGGFFHLENEKTKTRVYGYGHGEYIRLRDEYGNVWTGIAERRKENEIYYRFKASNGRVLSASDSEARSASR